MKLGIEIKRDKSSYISFFRKLFFGLGSIYSGSLDFYNFFYAIFLTDVIKLNPLYGGSVFLISKVWDALFVPFVGELSDKTKSRLGRRRLYFIIGIIPVFVTFFLLWNPPMLGTTGAKYAYVLFASILFRTVYNLVMIPYDAMRAQITQDYNERNIVNIFCLAFSIVSIALILAVPMYLTGIIESQRKVYFYMAVIFGSMFSMSWVGVFISTKRYDKYTHMNTARTKSFKEFLMPFKIRSFRQLAVMFVVAYVALDIMALLYLYYMKYYMGFTVSIKSAVVLVPLIIAVTAQAGMIPLLLKLSRVQSKSFGYILSGLIWCTGGYLLFTLPPGSSRFMLGVCLTLLGIGVSGTLLMLNSMRGDITDVGELYFNRRKEGALSGLMLFLRKISSAFAQFAVLTALGIAGYIKPVDMEINGIMQSVEQTQPGTVLFTIRIFISIIPAFLVTWGIVNAVKYPVSCRIHNKLVKYLKDKNEKGIVDELAREDLEKKLVKPVFKEMFDFIIRVWRSFYPEYKTIGTEKVIRDKPSVFVSNHAGVFGPVILNIFFPFVCRPWVISYITTKKKCEEHLEQVYFKDSLNMKAPWGKLLAKIMAPLVSFMMNSVHAIPVYRSQRKVVQTFKKSVKALMEGNNIILFPENANANFSENINDFYDGFVAIAKKYYSETSEEIYFYPIYVDKQKQMIIIGDKVQYDSKKDYKDERDRIRVYLRDYIDKLASIQKSKPESSD